MLVNTPGRVDLISLHEIKLHTEALGAGFLAWASEARQRANLLFYCSHVFGNCELKTVAHGPSCEHCCALGCVFGVFGRNELATDQFGLESQPELTLRASAG